MSGKWHAGERKPHWPTDRGFNKYFGLISGAANYFDISKGKRPGVKRRMAYNGKPWFPPREGFYMTDAITDTAVSFIESSLRKKEKPFFMYLAYTAPHWPLHALPEDIEKYEGEYMQGWEELRKQRYRRQLELGVIDSLAGLSPMHPDVPDWNSLSEEKKKLMDRKMAVYAAQIEAMDRGIGKILHLLEARGERDNTVIMFLSDNGACAEHGAFGTDFWNNGAWPVMKTLIKVTECHGLMQAILLSDFLNNILMKEE